MSDGIRDNLPPDPPPAAPAPGDAFEEPAGGPPQRDRNAAMMCHIGGFFTWFLAPFLIWKTQENPSRFLADHAKESLNFQIAVTIYYFVLCPLFPIILIYEIWVIVLACMAASRGETYRIPLNIRFIK